MKVRITVCAALAALSGSITPKEDEKPRVPALERVYKPSDETTGTAYRAWTNLQAQLRSNKVKTVGACEVLEYQPVPWFPACVYTDGATDAGERVYEKRCYFKKPVLIIDWIDTKKKQP